MNPFDEIKGYQDKLKSNIMKGFDNDIEKGGEGSKGGKVIGHTKSGKPIYDKFSNEAHKDFTIQDHLDAKKVHYSISSDKVTEIGQHGVQGGMHERAAKKLKGKESKKE